MQFGSGSVLSAVPSEIDSRRCPKTKINSHSIRQNLDTVDDFSAVAASLSLPPSLVAFSLLIYSERFLLQSAACLRRRGNSFVKFLRSHIHYKLPRPRGPSQQSLIVGSEIIHHVTRCSMTPGDSLDAFITLVLASSPASSTLLLFSSLTHSLAFCLVFFSKHISTRLTLKLCESREFTSRN